MLLQNWEQLASFLLWEAAAASLAQHLLFVGRHEVLGVIWLNVEVSLHLLVHHLIAGGLDANLCPAVVGETMLGALMAKIAFEHVSVSEL